MCLQSDTIYIWCKCEETDHNPSLCSASRRNTCPGLTVETVYMHCYCNFHATKPFKSEKKGRKAEEKHKRRQSQDSLDSASEKSSLRRRLYQWYQWRGLRV